MERILPLESGGSEFEAHFTFYYDSGQDTKRL